MNDSVTIRSAGPDDAALVLEFIRELAEYERLSDEVVATEEKITQTLFGTRPAAEVLIAELNRRPAGFALFFRPIRRSWPSRGSGSRTSSSNRSSEDAESDVNCSRASRPWPSNGGAADYSGRCWIGMNRRSDFIVVSEPSPKISGRPGALWE